MNQSQKFDELKDDIQRKILSKMTEDDRSKPEIIQKLEKLKLIYIDLPRTAKNQRAQLIGQLSEVFGDLVNDQAAAIDTLLKLLRKIENEFNQNNAPAFLDAKKKLSSSEISMAFKIITTKAKAYEYWRSEQSPISRQLGITIAEQPNFELAFSSSFDFFKDLTQYEYHKIYNFVKNNMSVTRRFYDDVQCIYSLYESFIERDNTSLEEIQLKAVIYAAYFELKGS
jgi:hypothetical protein